MLNDALSFAKMGIAVFPLSTFSKIPPADTNGVKDASTDSDWIRRAWMQRPHGNIGIALGKISGLVAIDLDSNHGATEEDFKKFPRTVTVKTKNGYHLYYRYPAGGVANRVVIATNIPGDKSAAAYLRSDGYYVVGAGSIVRHEDGEWEYQYHCDAGGELNFNDCALADLPAWCSDTPGHRGDGAAAPLVPSASGAAYGPNSRHDMFKRTAVAMRRRGELPDKILAELIKRNELDCNPPKADAQKELENIVKWAVENVQPLVCDSEYVVPLGWRDDCYFYTSDKNPTITCLKGTEHTPGNLFRLQPLSYWAAKYPTDKGGVNWQALGSDLMGACHDGGFFDETKVRGMGCWLNKPNGLVIHLGNKLWIDGKQVALNQSQDSHIYPMGREYELNSNPLTQREAGQLAEACESLKWLHPGSGKLMAGGLAVLRLCGALQWRPMFWLTGASGTGKSTLMENVVKPIAGQCTHILGSTTEAGIRQSVKWDSKPVIFDEAETTDERSSKRMKSVLELIRQASTMSSGRIYKGTASGKGLNFTANSSFILSSIRVNLTEEADINRFCLLELDRPDPKAWPDIKRAIGQIDEAYGDRLFSFMVNNWWRLQATRELFEEAIVQTGEDRRKAQQYSIILAGYWVITQSAMPKLDEAMRLASEVIGRQKAELEQEDDERQCLDRLLQFKIRTFESEELPIYEVITTAQGNDNYRKMLFNHGLDVIDGFLFVRTVHYELTRIYKDSKWTGLWGNSLRRLPGASKHVHRFAGQQQRCVKIPLSRLQD